MIHHLKEKLRPDLEEGSAALAYYFFNFGQKNTHNAETMLRSLVANICRHRPSIPDEIVQWHHNRQSPSMEDLERALRTVAADIPRVFVVIDALDEFPQKGRHELLELVKRINEQGPPNLHLLLSSRPERDIHTVLTQHAKIDELDMQAHRDEVDKDIAMVIDETFEKYPFDTWSPTSQTNVKTCLIEKAQGM